MKLLIADDEKLTREGIRGGLNTEALGISEVFLADDGVNALELARSVHPDIILTDVRMPRMTGVEMAEILLKERPQTVVIFMSAYSDKEYLKAAIKLKAVSYVEKPLHMDELEAALKEAAEYCRANHAIRDAARLQERDKKSQLALFLTSGDTAGDPKTRKLGTQIAPPITSRTRFAVMIIDFLTPVSELSQERLQAVDEQFQEFLGRLGLSLLSLLKGDHYSINFFYGPGHPNTKNLLSCAEFMREQLHGLCHFFISIGPSVSSMEHAFYSFQTAKDLLKESFFFDCDSIITAPRTSSSAPSDADLFTSFALALSEKNESQALKLAASLADSIAGNTSLSPSQARALYFRYLGKLDEICISNHISLWQREGLELESIWDGIMHCVTLKDLNQLLCDKVQLYFECLHSNQEEHPVIFQIKEYIHQSYALPTLSVPDVSAYVHLSSNYVCTLFKNETGQTLNQYLTDYRIKMSKQFLSDPRYKISDISAKVGYSDGNYYSKAFRKIVGLSPSEYREKMLS